MTKIEAPQIEKVQDAPAMSDEVVDQAFKDIVEHEDNQDVVDTTSNILDEHTLDQYDTRAERIAAG